MIKLGMNTAILGNYSLEKVAGFAASIGLKTLEAACWPVGKADRRYAGVTHIDVSRLTPDIASEIKGMLDEKRLELASLAYSPNPLTDDEAMRSFYFDHIKKVIAAASMLGVKVVDTFIGKNQKLSISENMELFKKYWPDIVRYAEDHDVIVTFENCPMYFSMDEWPGGRNLAVSPKIWREMFSIIDSKNFGITYDPSHFAWQRMNYIKPVYEFRDKIVNLHLKDTKFYQDRYDDVGFFACPLEFHAPKLPGLGDIDWGKLISALTDVGYSGAALIEVEDRSFEDSQESIERSIVISRNYMSQFIA